MSIEKKLTHLVMEEVQLLDEWRLDEWLDLYAHDARYWIPMDEKADPEHSPSIIYERKSILALRVEQLMRQNRLSQSPRSEVLRSVTNLTLDTEVKATPTARYNLIAFELRPGDWRQHGMGEKRLYVGRCYVKFGQVGDHWQIAHKQIVLLDRRQPIEGLSFIL